MLGSPPYYNNRAAIAIAPAPPPAHLLAQVAQTIPAEVAYDFIFKNMDRFLPADFDWSDMALPYRPPPRAAFLDMPAELRGNQLIDQDMDYNIAPRKTKNGGRFLGGLFESLGGIFESFIDIIKNLFGGDTDAFLRAKRAGKI